VSNESAKPFCDTPEWMKARVSAPGGVASIASLAVEQRNIIASLRAQLATVTAERDMFQAEYNDVSRDRQHYLAQRDEARGLVNNYVEARNKWKEAEKNRSDAEAWFAADDSFLSAMKKLLEAAARWAKEQG